MARFIAKRRECSLVETVEITADQDFGEAHLRQDERQRVNAWKKQRRISERFKRLNMC